MNSRPDRRVMWMKLALLTASVLVLPACASGLAPGVVRSADLKGRVELAGYSVRPPAGDWLVMTAQAMAADPIGLLKARARPLPVTEAITGHVFFARKAATSIIIGAAAVDARSVTERTPEGLRKMKEAALREGRQPRFRLLESNVSVDSAMAGCVRFDTLEEDREAPGEPGVLYFVSTRGRTCLHPAWPEYGIELAYTQKYRDGVRPLDVSSDGEAFLQSLEFTADRPLYLPSVRVGAAPRGIAAGYGGVWVTSIQDGTVTHIDARTNQVMATVPVGKEPFGVAVGEGAVWVANQTDGSVSRIDPRTGRVVATIKVQKSPALVAVGFGGVWVTNHASETVSRIDPETNNVVATIRVGPGPVGVAAGEGSVWVATLGDRSLARVDPMTNTVAHRIAMEPIVGQPELVTVGEGSVWVATHQGHVLRIDPRTNRHAATTFTIAGRLTGIGVDHGTVWVSSEASGSVWRIDPRTNDVLGKPLVFEGWPYTLVTGADAVWILEAPRRVRRFIP